jgi:hypothetical protein
MIQKHPDHDPANDENRVEPSVEITVNQGVGDHRDEMIAGRLKDGLGDAGDDLGGTLKEPHSASSDAVLDDQGIVGMSIRERFAEAGEALGEDAGSMPLPAPSFRAM